MSHNWWIIIDDVIRSRKVPFSELIENEILPIGFNFFSILMSDFCPEKFSFFSENLKTQKILEI